MSLMHTPKRVPTEEDFEALEEEYEEEYEEYSDEYIDMLESMDLKVQVDEWFEELKQMPKKERLRYLWIHELKFVSDNFPDMSVNARADLAKRIITLQLTDFEKELIDRIIYAAYEEE